MFLQNKYTTLYYRLISTAQARPVPVGYTERHHIVPKSIGGDNNTLNLVRLTAREHFICHKLLVRMTTGMNKRKMSYALLPFIRQNPRLARARVTSRDFQSIRELVGAAAKANMTGRIVSAETRAKQSASKKITHNSPEVQAKLSEMGKSRTPEHRAKIGASHKGKTITQSHRDAVSQKLSGSGNGRAKKWTVVYEDGRPPLVVLSLKTWCAETDRTFPGVFRTIKSGTFSQGVRIIQTI